MKPDVRHRLKTNQHGFTYLGLLLLLGLLAGLSALTIELVTTAAQRSNEAELQAIGGEFSHAFEHYYRSAANGNPVWPAKLNDLISDPRFPGVVRHLRRIYPNPLTGKTEWGIIPAPGGGIMGVFAIAPGTPIKHPLHTLPKLVGIAPANVMSTNATPTNSAPVNGYAEWRFGYDPMLTRQP